MSIPGKMKTKKHAMISFILALTPIASLILGFLFCLLLSKGGISDNDSGAVWWYFVFLMWALIPITPIVDIVSIVFGVKALKTEKISIAWAGIIIAATELLILVIYFATISIQSLIFFKSIA